MDWKELIGKRIKVWFDDVEKVTSKEFILIGISDNTLFYENGKGISLYRYIRHEVVE